MGSAKNATFLFNRDFMDYHNNRFTDFSLMVYKKEKLFALLPLNIENGVGYSHQGLTYGGLILQEKAKLFDSFEAFKEILKYLYKNNIQKLDIRIIPSIYNTLPSEELEYFLFKAHAKNIKKDVLMVIDYSNHLRFQKNRREGINKAKRNKLTLKIDGNFDDFWNQILIPNLAKKYQVKPVHSLKEIKLLATRFPNNIKQVNVYKDNKIVAGTTVFLTKKVIHPQYVSGNYDKNNLGSLDLLYDFICNHLDTNKAYFNFNISSENKGEILNKGLIFWKEGCGARTLVSNNFVVETNKYKTLEIKTK